MRDQERNRRDLRRMIAERGLDGVMEDLSSVCKDIAEDQKAPKYMNVWYDRANEFWGIAKRIYAER